jgi:geranylgeranyl diphosphate synthase type II
VATASYPDDLRDEVERYLGELSLETPAAARGLEDAMRYSLMAGGKRIRPVLALATARAIESDVSVLPFAAAIEMIHTYSLIHDDLPAMDDDDLRRGRPTCHVKFGEDVAILAGDGLYAEAFLHLLTHQHGDPAPVLDAARELAAATGIGGMVGGQYVDVAETAPPGLDALRELHGFKTGRLIGAAVVCVLALDGRPEDEVERWRAFASELGVLFQIVDDILDVTGEEADLGKPPGSDERHGKRTYVSELGLDGARAAAEESRAASLAALAAAAPGGAPELEQITQFIATRSS